MGKGRKPCCDKESVKKGPWSQVEDFKLISFIQKYGHNNWRALPKLAGLARCGKSCRLRWVNYLRPDIRRGNFTLDEEEAIIKLQEVLGNKWSKIASHIPGRTDNEIKNIWNTHLKKRLKVKESNNSSTTSSCNVLSTNVSTLHDDNIDKCKEDYCFEETLIHQGTTNNDTIEYSSSSSTSHNSFSDNLILEDHNPNMIENVGVHKDVVSATTTHHDHIEVRSDKDETSMCIEIPFEPNLDLWDLLHGESEVQFKDVDTPFVSEIDIKNDVIHESEGRLWWLVYLENELGLEHHNESTTLQ